MCHLQDFEKTQQWYVLLNLNHVKTLKYNNLAVLNLTGIRNLSFGKKRKPTASQLTSSNNIRSSTNNLNISNTQLNESVCQDFELTTRGVTQNLLDVPDENNVETKKKKVNIKNVKNKKLKANQISHYVTIIVLGFYFIMTTIPYVILLSVQNNLTLKLNYYLMNGQDYLNDPLWIRYGRLRDINSFGKLFFVSNHSINFFFYLIFNQSFRANFFDIIRKTKQKIKSIF